MTVLLLSRYGPLGASSRIRMYQYLPWLQRADIHVTAVPFFENADLARRYAASSHSASQVLRASLRRTRALLTAHRYDLIWIEYELFPWLPGVVEALLSLTGTPVIVEYDDAVFHRYDLHRSAVVRAALSRKIDRIMRRASAVIVGNSYLASRARDAGARAIHVIPSVVDLARYDHAATAAGMATTSGAAGANGTPPPVIGWIGSPSTAPYLHAIAPALREVTRDGRATVRLIGLHDSPSAFAFPCTIAPWDEAHEAAELHAFDIGIMPLPDQPWERGKCGYKLLQYMACRKPVVASPVGANCEIVQQGANGLLAGADEEWVAALETLLGDADLRAQYGQAGRMAVEQRYSIETAAPQLIETLRRTGRRAGADAALASSV